MLAHDQLITCSLSPEVTTAFFWRKLHLQVIKIHSVMWDGESDGDGVCHRGLVNLTSSHLHSCDSLRRVSPKKLQQKFADWSGPVSLSPLFQQLGSCGACGRKVTQLSELSMKTKKKSQVIINSVLFIVHLHRKLPGPASQKSASQECAKGRRRVQVTGRRRDSGLLNLLDF